MQRIIYANPDNTVSILIPSPEFISMFDTEQEAMEALVIKDVPNGAESEIVEISDIPSDRTFRNAWEHDTTIAPEKIKVNMLKAIEIAHTKRRADREELFKPLDIQATIPSQAVQAESDRQVVRDADALKQIAIDNATNEAELKTALGI